MVERNIQHTTNDFLKFGKNEIKKRTFIDLKKVSMNLIMTSKKLLYLMHLHMAKTKKQMHNTL